MARIPPFRIIDDFLDDALHGAILARALGHQADFAPSAVLSDEGGGYDTSPANLRGAAPGWAR